ncbi:MAG TPA: TIGR00730 family Rossman fold protein, partial [Thermoanaerobaculia bacterium]|nr:TIGR00730 family Rossman fold protein [Thermoanaerobaculia bacterium]
MRAPETVIPAEPTAGPGPRTVERLFLQGPRPRKSELLSALKFLAEFIKGFRALHFVGPCVTVFGSARFLEGHAYYALARAVGERLARMGFTVMTGGGPGLMEAANR